MEIDREQITFKVTLGVDKKWVSHLTRDELAEYIKERLNSSLGFRGQVKRFRLVSDKARREYAARVA